MEVVMRNRQLVTPDDQLAADILLGILAAMVAGILITGFTVV
jgi:hypothetical protein